VRPPTPESNIPIGASLTGLAYLESMLYSDSSMSAEIKLS
jgi:hypothetical protein